jgi:hypothetical protein
MVILATIIDQEKKGRIGGLTHLSVSNSFQSDFKIVNRNCFLLLIIHQKYLKPDNLFDSIEKNGI